MKRLQLAARQAWVRFQRWRYRLLARWLGVAPTGGGAEPGVVSCQIDGLGAQRLEAALRAGYLPFLRQLIERHGYQAQRWRCGVPADTPPVQGALLYGRNDQIPGFYWLDKRTGRWQSCLNPLHAALVEERLNHRGAALLAAEQLRRFAGRAGCGDLIVLGAYRAGQIVAFEIQLGCHGSLGGDQSYPFLLAPGAAVPPLDQVVDACALYPVLRRLVPGQPGARAAEKVA